MSIDELLNPRYKVIADWPGNNFYDIDEIIIMQVKSNGSYWNGEGSCYLTQEQMDKLPHLFRRLHWSEQRSLDEMKSVSYLKSNYTETVYMVDYYRTSDESFVFFTGGDFFGVTGFQPATEADYQAYINGVNK